VTSRERKHTAFHVHHHAKSDISEKNLLIAVVLNFTITAAEVVGGLLSNSLALLSDALHNLGDGVAILVAYLANRISKKDSNERKTFGYQRIEILAAFFNAVVLVAICIFLIVEAIHRFQDPEPIRGMVMFIVAGIGLAANLLAVILLRSDADKNMNIRAAYLHLLGDTFSSFAVLTGGILIWFFNIFWIDPLITILISLYIFRETFNLLRDSFNILMQSTPKELDLDHIRADLESIQEVQNIHHIHAWKLNEDEIHFEAHIDLAKDLLVSKTDEVRINIEALLAEKYHINHVTLQMEYGCCEDTSMIHHKKK
jgi:cobalt-zinc-cadmium efflux system protein